MFEPAMGQRPSRHAVISSPEEHFTNTRIRLGVLVQIKEALQPDGLFLGALFGGETLFELR